MNFNDLCPKHRPELLSLAKRYANNADTAEDLVQDALVRAFRHWDNFQQETDDLEADVRRWLKRIVTNTFYTQWQRDQKRNQATEEYIQEFQETPDEESFEVERLRRVMDKLRPMYKEVLELHYINGLTYQEMADKLGIKFVQAQKRLYRARQYIKLYYEHMGVSPSMKNATPFKPTKRKKAKADSIDSVMGGDDDASFSLTEASPDA